MSEPQKGAANSSSGRPSTSKRVSSTAGPKPPTTIHPSALIGGHAVLTGTHPIVIGPNVIIHPYARIVSSKGPVNLDEGCVIWEGAAIGVGCRDSSEPGGNGPADGIAQTKGVQLGKNVIIESGAVVEGAVIGDGTLVEADAKIGRDAVVGKHCKIAPYMKVPPGMTLPDFTVFYGANQRRVDTTLSSHADILDLKSKGHEKHAEVLRRLIPSHTTKWQ